MIHGNGRKVVSVQDGKLFIRAFLDEILNHRTDVGFGKSYDFDLYLPWMMDWVLNVPGDKEDQEVTPTHDLEIIYMDAAWELCQEGLLRPGPRSTSGEGTGGAYGKGYSLTPKGRDWIAEFEAALGTS
jgi:hypothetical protein